MNNNVRLYPWYFALSSFLAWMPVFFLYFSEYLDLSQVLLLEATYYITVVILEVPSGYFSDAFGRKKTLLLGALFLCIAAFLFILGRSFYPLVIAQIFFAGHMSFVSGTNTVFYYESLSDIGKESDYGSREAYVTKWSLISGGFAAFIGGWMASYSLSWAYWVTLLGAIPALAITFLFNEPIKKVGEEASRRISAQLLNVVQNLKVAPLGWIFAFYVLMFVMVHVPYEFYQPYLDLLDQNGQISYSSAPMMSGVLYSVSMFISAFAASHSIRWKNRIGLKPYLVIMLLFMLTIVALMSFFLHPFLMMVIFFRSFGWAAVRPPVNEAITPNVPSGERATFHSMMSLVCRLAFFALLFGLSQLMPSGEVTTWEGLSLILQICLAIGAVFVLPILYTLFKVRIE